MAQKQSEKLPEWLEEQVMEGMEVYRNFYNNKLLSPVIRIGVRTPDCSSKVAKVDVNCAAPFATLQEHNDNLEGIVTQTVTMARGIARALQTAGGKKPEFAIMFVGIFEKTNESEIYPESILVQIELLHCFIVGQIQFRRVNSDNMKPGTWTWKTLQFGDEIPLPSVLQEEKAGNN